MEGKDTIKELFSQKLGNHEVPVNPELWSSISAQIPSVTTTVATSVGLATKILIGISVAASLATGIYLIQSNEHSNIEQQNSKETLPVQIKKNDNLNQKNEIPSLDNQNSIDNSVQIQVRDNDRVAQNKNVIEFVRTPFSAESNSVLNSQKQGTEVILQNEIKSLGQVKTQEDVFIQESVIEEESIGLTTNENVKPSLHNNSTLVPAESSIQFTLPNVFTPNGDGTNDYLETKIEGVTEFSVVVLNENGKVVYQSQDIDFKWDGLMPNGDKAPQGTYVYYITGKDLEGRLVSKHSRLTIKY